MIGTVVRARNTIGMLAVWAALVIGVSGWALVAWCVYQARRWRV